MSELQSLSELFQNRIFRIPDYQRGYAWQRQQLYDFWDDLVNLRQERDHYTGLLSLKALSKEDKEKLGNDEQWLFMNGYKAYHVVDGQQRLTTFVILLNEIIELTEKLPENKGKNEREILLGYTLIRDIKEKYIRKKRPPEEIIITYLFGYENDNPSSLYLKHKILGQEFGGDVKETYYTKNLQFAKDFFAEQLQAYYEANGSEGIAALFQKLTLHMKFNIHEIEDDYDVFVAFETMNNRGKRLTNLELLKNRLIYLTTLYPETVFDLQNEIALREMINTTWMEVYYQLGRHEDYLLSDDEFLRAHWIMYYSYSRKKGDDYIRFLLRKFSHKNIFGSSLVEENNDILAADDEDDLTTTEEVEESVDSYLEPTEIKNYVNSLKETAEYWYYTFYPFECKDISEEEKVWIDKLNRLGIGYFRPMVAVSLMPKLGVSKDERLRFLKAVERFIFLAFRMAGYQSSYKSSDYYRKTRKLYMGQMTLDEIIEDLVVTANESAEDAVNGFITRMNKRFTSNDGFYSWRDLRYFLFEYEYTLASKFKLEKLSWAELTTVSKDKLTVEHILPQTPTKKYWRNAFRQFSAEEIRVLSASLGNLLPLSQSINSRLQNDSFNEKKKRGFSNGCHCELEVAKEEDWDAERIYQRGMKLLRFMEERWDFNFENESQMEQLLHVGFVHDGRAVPEELTEEAIVSSSDNDGTADRSAHVATLLKNWAISKDEKGELHLNYDRTGRRHIRFTTDKMSEILPDALEAKSGWGTRNYYFYEIENDKGKKIHMQLALNSQDIPADLKETCEIINDYFPSRRQKENWKWRVPFATERIKISEDCDDKEITDILEVLYKKLKGFEKELIEKMQSKK